MGCFRHMPLPTASDFPVCTARRGETRRRWELAGGTLEMTVHAGADPDGLLQVAERINPRRPFLFVSTVLGRHIPVDAARHRAVLRELAAAVPLDTPHPVLLAGFAETAVGLGAGVHDELARRTGRADLVCLSSTRHTGVGETWVEFREDHSHAPDHALLRPHPSLRPLVEAAETLVLVDDEASTGRTFAAVAGALARARGRGFRAIHLATLTDWSGGEAARRVAAAAGAARVTMSALVSGAYSWSPRGLAPARALPAGCAALPVADLGADPGNWRHGLPAGPPDAPAGAAARRTLVIGTGEYVWPAFLLAERIGGGAAFLATTRSPVAPGPAIRSKAVFADHYGLGIEMYLHNVVPQDWDRILLLVEGEAGRICPRLAAHLGRFTALTAAGPVAFDGGRPA